MKKLFTLLTLALISIGSAWAGSETPGKTGSSNVAVIGTSYTIAGTYVAGSGGVQISPMESQGVKVRLNSSSKLVISVNDGFEINSMTIYAVTNDNSKTSSVTSIKADNVEQIDASIVIPNKSATTAATINVSGIAAEDDITLTFSGDATQGVFDFHFTYTQNEVVTQEISAVAINGTAIDAADLATLKTDKAVTIDGSALNGIGNLDVTLSSGATTVSRIFSGTSAIFTFTINTTDTYTVTVTNVGKEYTSTGIPFYYSKDGVNAEGANTNTVIANGITFAMADASKTIQYGSGSVTIGTSVYQPIKLSTGSAMNVTFPEGTVAKKVKVYGWSVNGNGKLYSMGETSELIKSVDVNSDVYYATNTAGDIYPSVYEYDLDDYESFFFNPGGSPSQPFVVMEFTLVKPITPAKEYTTYVTTQALDFDGTGLTAYKATAATKAEVTMIPVTAVPAGTPLVLKKGSDASYDVPVAASADAITDNLLKASDGVTPIGGDGVWDYILSDGLFYHASTGVLPAGKAYLHLNAEPADGARELVMSFGDEATGIDNVTREALTSGKIYNLQGQEVKNATKGIFIVNGKKVILK